jgi:hypothetical protein
MTTAGFPHSEILESMSGCRLLEAYRRLQRPSSAPGAKTSTVCSYKLDLAKLHSQIAPRHPERRRRDQDARVHCAVLK